MNNQELIMLLKGIKTNSEEKDRNEPKELSFSYNGRDYSAEDVAELIGRIDVESLEENDIEFIRTLYQNLSSDNRGDNRFSNEEILVGPLQQKIQEYEYLVQQKEFESNKKALEAIQAHNSNLSTIKMINLKAYETDSHYDLDYLTITKEDGTTEVVSVPDPDYLERFTNEYASQISEMTATEFINAIRNSTDSTLDFVRLDEYLTNPDLQNKMHSPAIKDYNVLASEIEEVRRLVNQFLPNAEINISIDKNGEVFYKAEDGIIKGTTHDGNREVKFIQVPSKFKNNNNVQDSQDYNDLDKNAHEDKYVTQEYEKAQTATEVKVTFDKNKFLDMFEVRESIVNGSDEDKKTEFFNQMNALFDLCYRQTVSDDLKRCLITYYVERQEKFEQMQHQGTTSQEDMMNAQEYNLMEKLDRAFHGVTLEDKEELVNEVNDEVEEFGIEGITNDKPKVRTKNPPKYGNQHNGLSMIAIVLEIVCISLLVLLFLSLDI